MARLATGEEVLEQAQQALAQAKTVDGLRFGAARRSCRCSSGCRSSRLPACWACRAAGPASCAGALFATAAWYAPPSAAARGART